MNLNMDMVKEMFARGDRDSLMHFLKAVPEANRKMQTSELDELLKNLSAPPGPQTLDHAADAALGMLSSLLPIPSLGPSTEEGQRLPAQIAWEALESLAAMITDHTGPEETRFFNRQSRGTRAHFEGLWRWSVYLYQEYLLGTRLVRSSDAWKGLFLSVEIIFGNHARISPSWSAWIQSNPELLSLLTELWIGQVTMSPRRLFLHNRDLHRSPIPHIVCARNNINPTGIVPRWIAIAGGDERVATICLARMNDGTTSSDLDEVDNQSTAPLVEYMLFYSATFKLAFLNHNGAARLARVALHSLPRVAREPEFMSRFVSILGCSARLAEHSMAGMKQALRAGILPIALQLNSNLLSDSEYSDRFEFVYKHLFSLIRSNLIHYPVFQLVINDLASSAMPQSRLPRSLNAYPVLQKEFKALMAAAEYGFKQFPNPLTISRNIRKQICGWAGCPYSSQWPLARLSPECYRTLPGLPSSDLIPALKNDCKLFAECSACNHIAYCSQACQRRDWSSHKDQCDSVVSSRKKDKASLNVLKDCDVKLLHVKSLDDMHHFVEIIETRRRGFQFMNRSTSPYLCILEIDYAQKNPNLLDETFPCVLWFRKLKDVLEELKYSEREVAETTREVVLKGKRIYSVKYAVAGEVTHDIWFVPTG